MSLYEFHYIGGLPFMLLLSITLLAIIGLIVLAVLRGNEQRNKLQEAIKQVARFALAWGAFSTLVGLYEAFSDLERMETMLPLNVIMGGLKVALITTLYGFGIFLFAQVALILLRFRNNT